MIQTNAAWDTENAKLAKQPIYVLSLSGEARVYATHDLAAAGVTNPPADVKAWLKTPRGATASIDVLNGRSSIGELECEVIDQGGAVRSLVGGTVCEGKTATLSVGYPGIDYSEFVPLHVNTVYKVNPSKGYTSWVFRSRDRQMSAKRTVYLHPENGQPLSESNPWVLMGTPGEILQAVWLFGLGRSDAELDRATLTALDSPAEGLYQTVRPFFFKLTEAFEAKQFLEREVFRVAGLYPVISNKGQISVRASRPPATGPVGVYTFNESNMVVLPEIDRMPIVNEIVWKIDEVEGEHQNQLVFVEGTSISTYGRAGQHTIESKGLRTVMGAQWFCQDVARRLFRRFAGTPAGLKGGAPVARIEAFLLTLPVWVGDYVYVTHAMMPDLLTGALGVVNRLYEVIDREPDFTRGRMRYRLLDTGLTGLAGAYKWAASDRNFIIGASEVY